MAPPASDARTSAKGKGENAVPNGAPSLWALAGLASELAPQTERDRRLPEALVESMRAAGIFRMLVPAELGGGEAEPAELIDAVITLAEGDGSAGWCAAVGATSGMLAAYLPHDQAELIYGDPASIAGGVFAPIGQATPAHDGASYSVTGRWPFASGCEHSDWLMGGCTVVEPVQVALSGGDEGGGDEKKPRMLDTGGPEVRLALFPADQVQIHDTWNSAGLRGTGSHHMSVTELEVTADRTVSLITDDPVVRRPLYAFPVFGLLALSIAAAGVGIARGALRELTDLATAKRPQGSRRTLAQRSTAQAQMAEATAKVRAARALMDSAVADAWARASAGERLTVDDRVALRLAATHAMRSAKDATDAAFELGGGSAVYEGSPLQRRLRDIHTATQHMLVAPSTWELTGRVLLGEPADVSQL